MSFLNATMRTVATVARCIVGLPWLLRMKWQEWRTVHDGYKEDYDPRA
jgi:hypothetical protein